MLPYTDFDFLHLMIFWKFLEGAEKNNLLKKKTNIIQEKSHLQIVNSYPRNLTIILISTTDQNKRPNNSGILIKEAELETRNTQHSQEHQTVESN